jgi:hypothetical protein
LPNKSLASSSSQNRRFSNYQDLKERIRESLLPTLEKRGFTPTTSEQIQFEQTIGAASDFDSQLLSQTKSSRFAVVVPQNATESFAACYLTGYASDFLNRIDQSVVKRLVIALCVIMGQKSDNGGIQRFLPEKDHALQALLFDRSHETLDIRIQVGRTLRQARSLQQNLLFQPLAIRLSFSPHGIA